jgi:hypothetical protein
MAFGMAFGKLRRDSAVLAWTVAKEAGLCERRQSVQVADARWCQKKWSSFRAGLKLDDNR